ncbi:HNH endonuclease domain-containing protein [uncultured Litoreibacter sp.]|uniref:HNH endonuclease domain-containing protein n=1 Tax=uncultured Litoreibacter sp. TaxID=1392394 RepID=UPI0026229CAA|nr:HNH endonuclease domain-containing protein [uncultured Litoreibacter sp.]
MPYSTNPLAQHVWHKARPVKGKNPKLFRRDGQGNVICKSAYGKNSPKGWQVDHIFPKSHGGSNSRRNLQALQTRANQRKSNKVPKSKKRSTRRKRR